MSITTRLAVWEFNGEQRRALNRYEADRAKAPKPASVRRPEYVPYTHDEYVETATPDAVEADFRSGLKRIVRRIGYTALGAGIATSAFTACHDTNADSKSMAPPSVVHEIGASIGTADQAASQQELIISTTPIDLQLL